MALLPSPSRLRRALGRGITAVARRILRIQRVLPGEQGRIVPDDLPRDDLFEQPLTCEITGEVETLEDGAAHRAAFRVLVRDAAGKRCPNLAVEVRIEGPDRSATGQTTTSMLGVATFRMEGPTGTYTAEVLDVAAHALAWDRGASTVRATATAG